MLEKRFKMMPKQPKYWESGWRDEVVLWMNALYVLSDVKKRCVSNKIQYYIRTGRMRGRA